MTVEIELNDAENNNTLENISDEELLKISAEILEERAKVYEALAK